MVALGGSLHDLLRAAAALAALGLALAAERHRRRSRAAHATSGARAGPAPTDPGPVAGVPEELPRSGSGSAPSRGRPRLQGPLRALLVLAGGAALLAWRGDAVALWGVGLLVLAIAAACFVLASAPRAEPPARGAGNEAILWALALGCAALSLLAHRVDTDDAFYVNLAAAMSDAPDDPLLRDDTLHGVPGLPIHHPVYRVHAFEALAGAVALACGIPAIAVFHFALAALGACLVPLAQARLFRLLTPRTWLASVAALLLVLVAAGDAHRWYGNFAFVRIWQGKALLLFVFLPLVQAYALEFGLAPSPRRWLRLAAAQIAAVGASSSALWAAPAAAGIALACAVAPSLRGLRVLALGVLASLYVVGAGLALRQALAAEARAHAAQRTTAAEDAAQAERSAPELHAPGVQLAQSFSLVLGDGRLRDAAVVAGALGWAVLPSGLALRYAILGPLLAAVLLAPHASRLLAENVTGPDAWRALWVVPIPALFALAITAPLQLAGRRPRWPARAASLALAAAFALRIPARSSLSAENGVRLGWPGLKVPLAEYRLAERLAGSVPPGSQVVAPLDVSTWIPVFPGRAHPLVVLQRYLRWFGVEDVALRYIASMVAGGEPPARADAYPLFAQALERYAVAGALLYASPDVDRARRILARAGFRRISQQDAAEIWVRGPPRGPRPTSS